MTCEELEELAGALALGAALPHEMAAAREHLAICPRAHRSVRELAATAVLLAEAVEPLEPPAELRERILAAARGMAGPALLSSPGRAPRVPEVRGASWAVARRVRPAWLAAAAVLLLALGLLAWNVQLQRALDRREAQLAVQQRVLDAVARGARVVPFTAAPGLGGAHGAVVWEDGQPPVVVFERLPPPPAGRIYQLWAIRAGRPEDMGMVFRPDADGRFFTVLPDLSEVDAVAVTVEPGHVSHPTGPPVLTAEVSRGNSYGPRIGAALALRPGGQPRRLIMGMATAMR